MNKVKFLTVIIIGLLLTNMGMLWVFLSSDKDDLRGEKGPKKIVIERLHFDKEQVKKYDELIKWHRTEIVRSEKEMRDLKNKLYATLATEGNPGKDSLINAISTIQKEIENIHYKHFLDLKALCRPDQMQDFNLLSKDIARLFAPGRGKKEPENQ